MSQMARLMLLGVLHIWAVGGEDCWSYCITGRGSCLEIHQTDFLFDFMEIKADILR